MQGEKDNLTGFTFLSVKLSLREVRLSHQSELQHSIPGITSCRLVKDNKQAIELNSLLINNMPKGGYGWN